MGAMKDYSMWLEEKGYAEWNELTDDLEIVTNKDRNTLFNEYRADELWHGKPMITENDNA